MRISAAVRRFLLRVQLLAEVPAAARRARPPSAAVAAAWAAPRCSPQPRAARAAGALRAPRPPGRAVPAGAAATVFDGEYNEDMLGARGEGVARIGGARQRAPRFLPRRRAWAADMRSSSAVRASLREEPRPEHAPIAPDAHGAAVGRVAVPPAPDTAAIVDGARPAADIGRDPMWRVTFEGGRLAALERVVGGKVVETLTRAADGAVRLPESPQSRDASHHPLTRDGPVPAFDASIWRP